ncbi:hypothetical protein [Amantichitinum ursilacus]|uniref:Uncharacterized protein n=1 Tax=Amantichitinum ursilacus TaxID=857265 RepID=A0A0N0GMB6_9NEIS|nr:hypothetical protein [Amantichitinum ursilacus]KPC50767.1 hypothetical protein WG78_15765 [Amantichitinum ursilacus]
MQPKRPLNRYLPIRFANGEQIRQFSKPCVRCGTMLNARDMVGVARMLDDSLAIAAKAHCPKCGETFGVACRVDNQKRVSRVVFPAFLFSWFLRNMPLQSNEREPADDARLDDAAAAAAPAPAPQPQPKSVVRAEESVGSYRGKVIPAWVEVDGRQLRFDRISLNSSFTPEEFLLDEFLVYRG